MSVRNLLLIECELVEKIITVPFHSIRQSHVTGPSKMLKCHCCHGDFSGVLNSFGNHVTFFVACGAKLPKISQKFGYVTAILGGRRNQIFGRPVTRHGPCWIDWNGTVSAYPQMICVSPYISPITLAALHTWASAIPTAASVAQSVHEADILAGGEVIPTPAFTCFCYAHSPLQSCQHIRLSHYPHCTNTILQLPSGSTVKEFLCVSTCSELQMDSGPCGMLSDGWGKSIHSACTTHSWCTKALGT